MGVEPRLEAGCARALDGVLQDGAMYARDGLPIAEQRELGRERHPGLHALAFGPAHFAAHRTGRRASSASQPRRFRSGGPVTTRSGRATKRTTSRTESRPSAVSVTKLHSSMPV